MVNIFPVASAQTAQPPDDELRLDTVTVTARQTSEQPGIQEYIPEFIAFFNDVLIPFLFGIAFLIFVVNVVRYFIVGAANEKDRGNARMLALYTVVGFVTLILFWGVVNLIAVSTGLGGCSPVQSDYVSGNTAPSTDCYTAPTNGANHSGVGNNPGSGGNNAPGSGTNVAPGTHSGAANVPVPGSGGNNPPPTNGNGNNANPSGNPAANPFPTGGSIAPEEPSSIYCYLPNGTAIETTRAQCRLQGGTYND